MFTFLIILLVIALPLAIFGSVVIYVCLTNKLASQYIMTSIHQVLKTAR